MTTYKPYGIKELQDLLQQAKEQHLPVLTRHQRQDGIGIDFQNWNRIREIDMVNLTVTAERAVTLGELEEAVREKGLHVAAMTDDLWNVNLGDFFAEQMVCLTSLRYNQPRFQVLGLEVLLADGTVLSVAGKTVKNVTGYDMCRFYISNRETLAIPLVFTLKLVSLEPVQVMLEADMAEEAVLMELVRGLREQRVTPQVCLYWNRFAARALQPAEARGKLILVCNGSEERVKRQLQTVRDLMKPLPIDLQVSERPKKIWRDIKVLRSRTVWSDGLKVPSLQCGVMLEKLTEQQIGCWYAPLQGSLQLLPVEENGALYQRLCQQAEQLGGCGSWYYQYQYGLAPAARNEVWLRLKKQFDADGRLNPIQKEDVYNGRNQNRAE